MAIMGEVKITQVGGHWVAKVDEANVFTNTNHYMLARELIRKVGCKRVVVEVNDEDIKRIVYEAQ